ncbi:CheR family methyltransferase [Jannaschia ovalis]|uniref:Chemotaxis protein methyltransferase n=1 Tax=Jannaschia ovalis TaxID=3038773 RepID=A0ABY8LFR0_9RHOB|nr:CheR family methyltransferase [Jannaschia sp. GRR-S6-38]WGH80140.1 CheR family methyltransferase [Jannaschia sp. GRR-S6-38]
MTGTRPDALLRHDLELPDAEFRAIAQLMHRQTGVLLDDGSRPLVFSRLARHVRRLGKSSFADYLAYLAGPNGAGERERMIDALTTNTTRFFREPAHFELLRAQVMPDLRRKAEAGARVRLWSAACSSGEEAYSIAAAVHAAFPDAARHDLRILATDVNRQMLDRAQDATYPAEIAGDVPDAYRDALFEPAAKGAALVVRRALRDLVSVRYLNLMDPWPVSGAFDVIFCRNMAIYLDAATQARLWARLAGVLAPRGALFIGHSERLGAEREHAFETLGHTAFRLRGAPAGETRGAPCR